MSYRASDIMTEDLITVRSDMDVRELAHLFLEKQISGAPVVGENGELVGVISQTDLVYHSLTAGQPSAVGTRFYEMPRIEGQPIPPGFQIEEIHAVPVSELMTPVVHAVTEQAPVSSVMDLMIREHIHRVVVTRGDRAVGIVSALDVMDSLRKEMAALS